MVLGATARGLGRAVREARLVALLWAIHLLLAGLAALPLAARFWEFLPPSPDADLALAGDRGFAGIPPGLLHDLLSGQGGLARGWAVSLGAVAVLALALNALLAGGVLACLGRPADASPRPFGERFAHGAARSFGRFLRLGLVAAGCGALAAALPVIALGRLGGRLEKAAWEPAEIVVRLAGLVLGGLLLVLVLVALDLARIEIARTGARRVVRLFFRRLASLLRRPARPLGLWLGNALLLLPAGALYLGLVRLLPSAAWPGIAVTILGQQGLMATRALLRVALWSAEGELAAVRWPDAPPAESGEALAAEAAARPTAGAA